MNHSMTPQFQQRRKRDRRYQIFIYKDGRKIDAARIGAKSLEEAIEKARAFFGYFSQVEVKLKK